jgi:hypothetical protein
MLPASFAPGHIILSLLCGEQKRQKRLDSKAAILAVQPFNRFPLGRAGNRLHLAAFLVGFPSKGQEIDDKL